MAAAAAVQACVAAFDAAVLTSEAMAGELVDAFGGEGAPAHWYGLFTTRFFRV